MIDKDRVLYYNYNSAIKHFKDISNIKIKNNKQRKNFKYSKKISSSHDCLSRWDELTQNHVRNTCSLTIIVDSIAYYWEV